MAKQEIKNIKVSELRLWSENPRDPIGPKSTDFDVIKRAIDVKKGDCHHFPHCTNRCCAYAAKQRIAGSN